MAPLTLVCDGSLGTLYHGDQAEYDGPRPDLILTNPYAPLPCALLSVPMLLCQRAERKLYVYDMVPGVDLIEVARWGHNAEQAVWAGNMPFEPNPLDLSFVGDEVWRDNRGWFPLDLPVRLIERWFGSTHEECDSITVWDGFMGRGTVGKACQLLGHSFIGIDIDRERVELAEHYLRRV